MRSDPFTLFGPLHLGILAGVTLAAAALAILRRRRARVAPAIEPALACAIVADAVAWYGYELASGAVRPPHGLPLELCDVVQGLTVYALLWKRPWAREATYFLGLSGSGLALLTPDVGGEPPSWAAAQFFVAHGLVVVAALFLPLSGTLRPRPGTWWRVFLGVNAYAAVIAVFDAAFGTNYMYLRERPRAATLLDLLGPWPWYILAGELVALVLLLALDLPFRRSRRGEPPRRRGCRQDASSSPIPA